MKIRVKRDQHKSTYRAQTISKKLNGRASLWFSPDKPVNSLSDYIALVSSLIVDEVSYWYRGQADISWSLCPSALRNTQADILNKSITLFQDFMRIAEFKLKRPPPEVDILQWLQLAQHYKVPSCLLDWTESALNALYFACADEENSIGAVYFFKHTHLSKPNSSQINSLLLEFIELHSSDKGAILSKKRRKQSLSLSQVYGVNPKWNSERLVAQRGTFTLHTTKCPELIMSNKLYLQVIPILPKYKQKILKELASVGVDEFSLFPELDRMTDYLKKQRGIL